jgi:hypothetical protein
VYKIDPINAITTYSKIKVSTATKNRGRGSVSKKYLSLKYKMPWFSSGGKSVATKRRINMKRNMFLPVMNFITFPLSAHSFKNQAKYLLTS